MLHDMGPDDNQTGPQERVSVAEAAAWLGVTEDAVRKRIHRGKIGYEQDPDGRYWVYPTEDDTRQTARQTRPRESVQSESGVLISELRAQIGRLEDQLDRANEQLEQANERDRENRRLLAAALERIPPQLEAPSEPPESPETATEGEAEPRPGGAQEGAQRPWWRRVFGG
jgi:hypothetical protein